MKKEFLDKLYELRALIQIDIDSLIEKNKEPISEDFKGCGNEIEAELRTRRSQIGSTNKLIEQYLEIHNYDE